MLFTTQYSKSEQEEPNAKKTVGAEELPFFMPAMPPLGCLRACRRMNKRVIKKLVGRARRWGRVADR